MVYEKVRWRSVEYTNNTKQNYDIRFDLSRNSDAIHHRIPASMRNGQKLMSRFCSSANGAISINLRDLPKLELMSRRASTRTVIEFKLRFLVARSGGEEVTRNDSKYLNRRKAEQSATE